MRNGFVVGGAWVESRSIRDCPHTTESGTEAYIGEIAILEERPLLLNANARGDVS